MRIMGALIKIVGMMLLGMFMLGAGQGSTTAETPIPDGSLISLNLVYTADVGGKIDPCG